MRPPLQRNPYKTARPIPTTPTTSKKRANRATPGNCSTCCSTIGEPRNMRIDLGPPTIRPTRETADALCRPPTKTAPTKASSAAHPNSPKVSTGQRRCEGVGAGGAVTPRATAHDPAKRRGSKALFPSTSSAEPPSDLASSMSADRSAAISLAMGSGTPRRRHSRRHSSMNSFTAVPPM